MRTRDAFEQAMHNRTAFETQAQRLLGFTSFRMEYGRYCHQPLNELLAMYQAAYADGARAERTRAQTRRLKQMAKRGERKHG